jgi:hypothetical protein
MKTILPLFGASLLLVSLSASAYNDPPKDQKCIDKCNLKYTPEYTRCKAVAQCEAFVQYEAGNCIHECPDAK